MNIKPPGMPQLIEHQPELHTFIGDTPQRPEPSPLELSEASFSAIRAYADVTSHRSSGAVDDSGEAGFDIRSAPPDRKAEWVRPGRARLSH